MNTPETAISTDTIIDDITAALHGKDTGVLHNASYETGLLGYALYFAYLSRYTGKQEHIETSQEYFSKAISALDFRNFQRIYDTDSLDGHLSHIGRFAHFAMQHNLLEIDAENYLQQLDSVLFDLLKSKVSIKDFDSLSGAMASGFYFLTRMRNGMAVEQQLEYLVNSLQNFAEKDNDGDYYWKSPSLYNRVYLGISHGSCLLISFLASAYELGIARETCRNTIEKAVAFVRKQYRKSPYKGLFPNMIGDPIEPMQFALCYGDIGNGYALLKAALILEDSGMRAFADMVLDDCLTRSKEDNLTLDASIFYGASGLVIAFAKLADMTGDVRFAERRDYWYDQIAAYKIAENNYAGFASRLDESELWNVAMGWGIIGIGLTLMAYSDKQLPPLDKLTFIA